MKMIESRLEQRGQGGFTLIELLVVIAILAVLGGAVIIGIGAMRENASEQVCKTNKETIETAAEAYRTGNPANAYPASVAALTAPPSWNTGAEPYLKASSITPTEWGISGTGVVTNTGAFPATELDANCVPVP